MLFIDTVVLAGVTHPTLRYLPPNGPQTPSLADDEWSWIETTLQQSTADWLIVSGHYPGKGERERAEKVEKLREGDNLYMFLVWSVAEHGPTDVLVQKLRPLLMKYNVTA